MLGGKWSTKYKKSINCKKPKGFSQKQYCKYGKAKKSTIAKKKSTAAKKKSTTAKKKSTKAKKKSTVDCRTKRDRNKSSCKKKMKGGKVDCRFKKNKSINRCKLLKKTKKPKKSTKSKNSKVKKSPKSKKGLKLYKPVKSDRSDKKMMVLTKKGIIHFGQVGYEDYLMHKDKNRRKNYCARSKGIRDGSGKPTYNNKESANYWAREVLWKC